MVRHHLAPIRSLAGYDRSQARLHALPDAPDWRAMEDFDEVLRIAEATEIAPVSLSEDEITALLAFLGALTDPQARRGRLGAPSSVPSGLPMDRLN
jgi:cytochrome c peroxidase